MSGSAIELLFLAGIAAFIAFRVYSVLGRRTGNEPPPVDPFKRRDTIEGQRAAERTRGDNVVPLPRTRESGRLPGKEQEAVAVQAGTPLALGFEMIAREDKGFDAGAFLAGAKRAHEMIARAFADGDRDALKPLLSPDVFVSFENAISAREKAGHKIDYSFVGLKGASFDDAGVRGKIAEITVRFVSELISATRDAAGAVIEGAVDVVREVTDVWTFARDTRSSDPNWKVVATAGAT